MIAFDDLLNIVATEAAEAGMADDAIRWKCAACDHRTEPLPEPPTTCPNCGLVAGTVNIGPKPPRKGQWEPQCARCGSSVYHQTCENCCGEGVSGHDCGEDSCCCADPDEDNVRCDVCGGDGGWYTCLSGAEWCEANPLPGRAKVPRGKVEWYSTARPGRGRGR